MNPSFHQPQSVVLSQSIQSQARGWHWALGATVGSVVLLSPGLWTPLTAMPTPPTQTLAAEAKSAPAELTTVLAQMDDAANQRNLKALMRFYSRDFSHSDGLDRTALQQVIKTFWQQTQTPRYTTELLSWKAEANGYRVETKTTITGTQSVGDRPMQLTATLHSRQRWQNQQITRQEILAEQSQLISGTEPPKVMVKMPETVGVGETYDFEVIVEEPLEGRILLGTVTEEAITAQSYFTKPTFSLEELTAGGLFKIGQAPDQPTQEWISAVLVQDSGITIISRRLNVVQRHTSAKPSQS